MGVREFNVWEHQPQLPGFPLYIFCGWIGANIFGASPQLSLHLVSALGGALFVAAWFLIIRLQFNERLAWWVATCLAITPVMWMTATKVLSDAPAAGFLSAEVLKATKDAVAVYTDDDKFALPAGWRRIPLAEFRRSVVIHMKASRVQLFLIDRGNTAR